MSESLRASMEKLKQSSSRLNRVADEAAQVVAAVEAFLSDECGAGVAAWTTVSAEDLGFGREFRTALGYIRWGTKFRIVVSVGSDPEDDVTKPWSEWDRAMKLETVKKLPDLLESISNQIDAQVEASRQTTTTVAELLKVLDRKGGK